MTSINFWFKMYPGTLSPIGIKLFSGLLLVFLFLSLFSKLKISKSGERIIRRLHRKLLTFYVTQIVLLLFMFFFMYENIPFLAARAWFLFWLLGVVIWLYFIFIFFRGIPKHREDEKKEEEYKKYLPK